MWAFHCSVVQTNHYKYQHNLWALFSSTTYACFIALTNVFCITKLKQCFINSPFVLVRVWWIIWRLSPNCFHKQLKNGQSRTRKDRFVVYDLHKGNFCTMRTKQNYCTLYSHYTIVQYIMYIILYIMMSISETDQ